jgi:two-component system sensor histidine kinase DesK
MSDLSDVPARSGSADPDRANVHPVVYRRSRILAVVFTSVWIGYLAEPIGQVWQRGNTLHTVLIFVVAVPFAALYVSAIILFRGFRAYAGYQPTQRADPRVWVWLGLMAALTGAGIWLAGSSGVTMVMFTVMISVFNVPVRAAGVIALIAIAGFVSLAVWGPHSRSDLPVGTSLTLAGVVALVTVGRLIVVQNNRLEAGFVRQRHDLALAQERNRVARDVHDILGHSLTVITVKSELAQRLIDLDLDRARHELADIERLAREALAGVRDTVGGLREVSLEGELANARTALSAAGIEPELPFDVGSAPPSLRPILGWVLREAVTNVVRHSGARRCVVTVGPTGIEIIDDGKGFDATGKSDGSGLHGLGERVAAAGGTLRLGAVNGHGFRLAAEFPSGGKEPT